MLLETNHIYTDFGVIKSDDVVDQDLVLVTRNHNNNSGKTTMFIFQSHVGFKLSCEHLYYSS